MKKYLLIALILAGCGEDSSPPAPVVATDGGLSFTGEAILAKWKAICIDGNAVNIEARYQQCLWIYSGSLNTPCDQGKISNLASVTNLWQLISESAMATYHGCLSEGYSPTLCQGDYEKKIAFEVDLKCEEYATKY